jgi:hypothetical protein
VPPLPRHQTHGRPHQAGAAAAAAAVAPAAAAAVAAARSYRQTLYASACRLQILYAAAASIAAASPPASPVTGDSLKNRTLVPLALECLIFGLKISLENYLISYCHVSSTLLSCFLLKIISIFLPYKTIS